MDDPLPVGRGSLLSTLDFLASSRHRFAELNRLRAAGPATRRDVRGSVDAPRSTVRRTLKGFLERDWIASTDEGYRVTAAGSLVAEEFERFRETVRVTDEYAPLPGTCRRRRSTSTRGGSPAGR